MSSFCGGLHLITELQVELVSADVLCLHGFDNSILIFIVFMLNLRCLCRSSLGPRIFDFG